MAKENLDETIRSAVRAYAAECEAAGRPPVLWTFAQQFPKHAKGAILANAIHKIAPGVPWRQYLAELQGVELFPFNQVECIRLRADEAAERKPHVRDARVPLEESCRLALLLGDGTSLPEELAAACRTRKGGGAVFLRQSRDWAKKGRDLRKKAGRLVADGETKQDLSFDELKAAVRKLVADQLTGDRAISAAGWILAPFFGGEEELQRIAREKKREARLQSRRQTRVGPSPVFSPGKRVERLLSGEVEGHPNCLHSLPPSPSWTVLVDETGSNFGAGATGFARGRMVAVFVPESTLLPNLPKKWHAVERTRAGFIDEVVETAGRLLGARCGILGIPVSDLPGTTAAERRLSCLADLLDLALRLLPVDGPTKLVLRIEQWGNVSGEAGDAILAGLVEGALHRLAFSFPSRATLVSVSGKVIPREGNTWNGYADAVAYAWGSDRMAGFLSKTRWIGPCFLEGSSASVLRKAMDAFRTDGIPAPADWTDLLSLVESEDDTSVVSAFLRSIGREAQFDPGIWRTFLDETRRHLDSKAIRMDLLGRQLRWLKKWEPVDAELPLRVRLMWLCAELAAGNHAGRGDLHGAKAFREEFDELCLRLFREDCPLCAHANLHLAVSYTNAFEFDKARLLLLPMRKWSVAEPGLRMWGRLQSTFGQLEAFSGSPILALRFFDEAVRLFRDLSEGSDDEISQTRAYAATAAMDAKTPDADERLAGYLWNGLYSDEALADAARRLAVSSEPKGKYKHHVILRRLVELPEDHPARVFYLSKKQQWSKPAVGHPWELIEFYRALLLPEGGERDARLETAFGLAMAEGGATLRVIAAVIRGATLRNGGSADARHAYRDFVERCAVELPALGEARLAALRGQLDPAARLDPLSLAKAVLPFNFR